jgi:hypothetical protein
MIKWPQVPRTKLREKEIEQRYLIDSPICTCEIVEISIYKMKLDISAFNIIYQACSYVSEDMYSIILHYVR